MFLLTYPVSNIELILTTRATFTTYNDQLNFASKFDIARKRNKKSNPRPHV